MRRGLLYLLTFILFSCGEDKIETRLMSVDADLLVVEAVLTNENKNHKILLTHPYQMLNGKAAPASGATIIVVEGNDKVLEVTEVAPGEYVTETMTAVYGKIYTLYIQYKGREYYAFAGSVPVEPMNPLQYDEVQEGRYQLRFFESGSSPNYVDHSISWKTTPACAVGESCEARIVYYDLKTIDVNELFKPDKAAYTVPLGTVVIRRKYSVSPAHKNYLRSLLSETEWRGGVFDIQRENVPTNLSEGAVGYFAVASVLSDTTIIIQKP